MNSAAADSVDTSSVDSEPLASVAWRRIDGAAESAAASHRFPDDSMDNPNGADETD